jgi:hypothetical protein
MYVDGVVVVIAVFWGRTTPAAVAASPLVI